ncbi:hypothetical protein [Methylogaea oryzae]|uniref:Uncharacterized protein n=1 Tax=Methylogaea oryzae TaxID=1295382 RepID=A0A8D4VPB9_9GAMM|nr:hypothetical protein [Methylogaea oryzae]BBL70757.1 hypothetical protein MoryE10_13630 [Methylogaea oryzae]
MANAQSSEAVKTLPIRRIDGKFRAAGAVIVALGLVAALAGAWWGPAMLFPGAVILFMGRSF